MSETYNTEAPKAEPVSDPYKLEFEPCYGCGANEPSERCLGCSHDFQVLNRQETIDSSEAPKVEQEPSFYGHVITYHYGTKPVFVPAGEVVSVSESSTVTAVYDRPWSPAPASDELLETIDMDDFNIIGDWIESGEKGSAPSGRVKGLWQSVRRVIAIAKHKGPQS